ncbi:MAG: cation:proton antiporter [Steroidobacteraceae bacterium]
MNVIGRWNIGPVSTPHLRIAYSLAMEVNALGQLLILLASSVLVVTVFRRMKLPPIVGYLAVGMLLGAEALSLAGSETTHVLAEFGVVFLVFTLGLEFSYPRMLAMRWEVFGLGGAQVVLTTALIGGAAWLLGVPPLVAVVLGGALAMSSTAIVVTQLTEQLEVNRPHGRLAVGILLFQDLAFVPLLALESALHGQLDILDPLAVGVAMLRAGIALLFVIAAGRWLLRPLFHEITHARSTEVFTLTVLLVTLTSAWATNQVGLSLALGAFLAGMMLAETEYRHQIEVVIRPFRDILLGLFFITVGTLLDLRLLIDKLWLVLLLVLLLQLSKALIVTMLARRLSKDWQSALQTGLVIAQGGEFGFALLTLTLNDRLIGNEVIQPLLAATVVSMVLSPFLIRHNSRVTESLLNRGDHELNELQREMAATHTVAQRNHVILCGFGRVGQNLARALENHGYEYIALDMDPKRVQQARHAGDPVFYGDASESEILEAVGLEHCSVLVISFSDPNLALRILHSVRELRKDVPVLVRTQDDTKLNALQAAGATEVVPETLEASLMLMSHMLLLLKMPVSRVVKTVSDIRDNRYAMLRRIFRRENARPLDETHTLREELHSVVLPRHAYAIGRSINQLKLAALGVSVNAIRRDGIVGREPDANTVFREGDVVVLYGNPEALDQGESVLLIG